MAVDLESFIVDWTRNPGGAERANSNLFFCGLCDVLGVDRPRPAEADASHNDYVFERTVAARHGEATTAPRRIDLYKRGAFILEAKQSRMPSAHRAAAAADLSAESGERRGRRSAARGWDALMANALNQARDYVFRLPADHRAPPFLIVCDIGHAFEIYADFTGSGRNYEFFPDRQGFRIFMEDLREPEVRARLAAIWTDPQSLNPARHKARATRLIAQRLAQVSKVLEAQNHPPEEVALFLMRCIFTMFASGVGLLPSDGFTELLDDCLQNPSSFAPLLGELWAKMDEPDYGRRYFSAFRTYVPHFNGKLFHKARAFPLAREQIAELRTAADCAWTDVEPAIFGALLEQALSREERSQLGAHYTPRAHVIRLVNATVMEPLRADWQAILVKIERAHDDGDMAQARRLAAGFHRDLCRVRVLDPACGTGNFLYVALELMKKLEGEVLETLAQLGVTESIGLETVDPHQFLGLELNPRATAIAELVIWIGYLQLHYRTHSGHPAEPILRAFKTIRHGDAVLNWDGYPLTQLQWTDGEVLETCPNPRRPPWPEAEFIVGNPPFIGGKDLRSRLPPATPGRCGTPTPR